MRDTWILTRLKDSKDAKFITSKNFFVFKSLKLFKTLQKLASDVNEFLMVKFLKCSQNKCENVGQLFVQHPPLLNMFRKQNFKILVTQMEKKRIPFFLTTMRKLHYMLLHLNFLKLFSINFNKFKKK